MSSSRPVTPNSRRSSGNNNSNSGGSHRRHSHRSSGIYLLTQSPKIHYPIDPDHLPLESALNTEKFERLSDSLEELDANLTNLQSIHEAISGQFNESFASFLYGLSITMWCVDFPGCPTKESWAKLQSRRELNERIKGLEEKVKQSKSKNEDLKKKLREVSVSSRAPIIPDKRSLFSSNHATHIVDEDESPSFASTNSATANAIAMATAFATGTATTTTPSSRLSRIPQPVNRSNQEVTVSTTTSRRVGPNLNQPPRYLKGLFDSSNTRSSAHTGSATGPTASSIIRSTKSKSILNTSARRNPVNAPPNRISKQRPFR
ncbi:DASH complex subunit Dam1-domain-containing protein [Scheffersomyces amazonensis]|uniref:DASH complex subunit Dam1-domain-containing protein n=1 Tax=Scheffersomyces amazonensis TaxID=1078765 RepID=UPI00315DA269